MSALASAINQHLHRGLMSQQVHVLLRSWLLNLQAPKPSSKAACSCSCFLHVLQGFLNYSRSSGAPELAHLTCWKTCRKQQSKGGAGSGDFTIHRRLLVPFALHKSPRNKSCDSFQRNLKAFEPEEQQQRGDADSGTTADGVGFHRVWRRRNQSKATMLRGICIINLQNDTT